MKINQYLFTKKLFQTLSDTFHQNSFATITTHESKLRTYGTFKKDIGFEKYLSDIKDPKKRAIVTKLRLSNHRLMIEVGRHKNIPKELHFCPYCPNKVETEAHFLLECSVYKLLREEMMHRIDLMNKNFKYYPEEYKLQYLLFEMDLSVSNYIVLAWELRLFDKQT